MTEDIITLILIPSLIVALLIVLVVLLKSGDKDNLYKLQRLTLNAMDIIDKSADIKSIKKLDVTLYRLLLALENALYDDIYDLSPTNTDLNKARQISRSLLYAQFEEHENRQYFDRIKVLLQHSYSYVLECSGVNAKTKKGKRSFNKTVRQQNARKYLEEVSKE